MNVRRYVVENGRMDVFVLQHLHLQDDGGEDVKMIGVYSSREAAEGAVERLRGQPGFRDAPEGFQIDRYSLDADHWVEGYKTLRPEAGLKPRAS